MEILIVDDDAVDRELVINTLQKNLLQVNIKTAFSVEEGLQLCEQGKFDVILLDCHLPRRDGIELILELRNEMQRSHTAIVMMCSAQNEELALECIKAGAQDFIVKAELTASKLTRALLHAQARYKLERKLYDSYQTVKRVTETDSLTGLANRYLFDETLKISASNNLRGQNKLALILIDLDNFKFINDTHGHDTGDKVLIAVASRLGGVIRNNEMFARLGGDEFAIILGSLESQSHANLLGHRLLDALKESFIIDDVSIKVTVSIGIAVQADRSVSSLDLMKHADIAMYRAKNLGRDQLCFFQDAMQEKFSQRYLLEQEIVQALEKDEFILHFQPIHDLSAGHVSGFEALVRWDHPDGLRGPNDFIPVAEESKLIKQIGAWVLREAVAWLSRWNKMSAIEYSMAVNVSATQLEDSTLVELVDAALKEYGVTAGLIELELTETALLSDSPDVEKRLVALRELGCRIALDDFGTGFSSVAHLLQFPINTVKIDRSIMPGANSNTKSEKLMRGLVSMVDMLGLDLVAEGIETEAQLLLCTELGVERGQGYFFAKPLSPEDVAAQLFSEVKMAL